MTGFGAGDAPLGDGRVLAEVRSVNQRFLEVRAKLPRELVDLVAFTEQVARERLKRGRVEIAIHAEGAIVRAATLDKEKAKAAMAQLAELRDEIAPGSEVPLSLLAVVPDLFAPPAGRELEAMRAAVKSALSRAMDAMDAMCAREGESLAADFTARLATLEDLVTKLEQSATDGREAFAKRMRERLARALASADVKADPARLEQEIVLASERTDVAEELTRLASHLDQMTRAIGSGEPVGRRLDFLLQEMLREANTLGAKAQDAETSQLAVAMKLELERAREQAQNVE